MPTIKLQQREWEAIRTKLKQDYPPGVLLIRARMREVLGFTPRDHGYYNREKYEYIREVHLDFYDDSKETFFRLRYL